MKRAILTVAASTLLSLSPYSNACDQYGKTGFVAKNNLWIPASVKSNTGMTKAVFNKVLDRIERIYAPILKAKGKKLVIERKWSEGTVNAYAQRSGNAWKIAMFGGLARHETVTPDGFAMVACHELGHHIGGLPQKTSWFGGGSDWASNEGQSDYWGAMKCFRKYIETEDNIHIMKGIKVPQFATQKCQRSFSNAEDVAICQRTAMGGMSLAGLFGFLSKLTKPLAFKTPDPKKVTLTNHNHPASQCRLDTYFAGAICEKNHHADIDYKDEHKNLCARDEGFTIEARPLCWYKPSKT